MQALFYSLQQFFNKAAIILFLLLCIGAHAQWARLPQGGGTVMRFVNEKVGFRFINKNNNQCTIEKTIDAGLHWTTWHTGEDSITSSLYGDLLCVDSNEVYALFPNGALHRTLDGKNWNITRFNTINSYCSVLQPEKNTIWVVLNSWSTSGATIYESVDKGNSWNFIGKLPSNWSRPNCFSFINRHEGWFIKGQTLYHSTNSGASWTSEALSFTPLSVHFTDSMTGWLGMSGGKIAYSNNGGATLMSIQLFKDGDIQDILSVNSEIWVCSSLGGVARKSANSANWDTITVRVNNNLQTIYSMAEDWGYIGSSSTAFRFSKKQPVFYINKSWISINDTLLTVTWESIHIEKIKISFSSDEGNSWKWINGDINASQLSFSFPVGCHQYYLRIYTSVKDSLLAEITGIQYCYPRSATVVAANEVMMMQNSDGRGSYNTAGPGNSGFYWPGGYNAVKTAIFMDGLVFAGKKNGALHVGGSTYRTGLQSGVVFADGSIQDKSSMKAGNWKIKKNWRDAAPRKYDDYYLYDSINWPVEWGAPFIDVNADNRYTPEIDKPAYIGDEVLWFAANDFDSLQCYSLAGTPPLGVELQCLVFAVNKPGLENTVFKQYTLTNRSNHMIDSLYMGYWSDPDLGEAQDDYIGYDTMLSMMYVYNADNADQVYSESAPPALGYALLSGPKQVSTSTDSAYFNFAWNKGYRNVGLHSGVVSFKGGGSLGDPMLGTYAGALNWFNILNGKDLNGAVIIDPVNNKPTSFTLAGDPVTHTGWYEGGSWPGVVPPGDRRMMMGCTPVTLAPGEKQEFAIAISIQVGADNLQSITKLRESIEPALKYYHSLHAFRDFTFTRKSDRPSQFRLYQNFPNPFNPATTIRYDLIENTHVQISIYDVLGRELHVLVDEIQNAGTHNTTINASALGLASGVYFYRIECNGVDTSKKMMVLK